MFGAPIQDSEMAFIAENDPMTVRAYELMLKELSGIPAYQKYLEFILMHAGSSIEISLSGLPGRLTRISNQPSMGLADSEARLISETPKKLIFVPHVRRGICTTLFPAVTP